MDGALGRPGAVIASPVPENGGVPMGERVFVCVVLAILIILGTEGARVPPVSWLETKLDDLRVAMIVPPSPVHPDIRIIKIDEASVDMMRQRSPVDRQFLTRLLAALDEAKPASIAIDILFDQHTDPESDEALRAQLGRMTVPVVIAAENAKDDPDKVTPKQDAWAAAFDAQIGNSLVKRGHVRLLPDPDDVVRRLPDTERIWDGQPVPALGAAAVAAAGRDVHQVMGPIAWYGTYHGTELDGFREISAELLKPDSPGWAIFKHSLAGKIIFIGTTLPLDDRHEVPWSIIMRSSVPGVYIQATIAAQLLDGRWIRPMPTAIVILVTVLAVAAGFAIGSRSNSDWLTTALLTLVMLLLVTIGIAAYWIGIDHGRGHMLMPIAPPVLATGLATALGYALTRRRFRDQRNFVRQALGKYVSPAVAKQLIAQPHLLRIGGQRLVITALFTDIAGFTNLSESLEPAILADVLNRYLSGMGQIILKFDGTIDKYIGDAIVAIWGAPLMQPDHAARAVACGIELAAFSRHFAAEQQAVGLAFGHTRIGIQTGAAIVGNFGGEDKVNYTAIGDTINTASRLEGANKYLGSSILIGSTTAEASGRTDLRPVADLVVKGRVESLRVFEPVPEWNDGRFAAYLEAYRRIEAGDPSAAEALIAADPDDIDSVVRFYRQRLADGQTGVRVVLDDK